MQVTNPTYSVAHEFRSLKMAQLRELTIYCKWYLEDIPEYDVLISAWQGLAYLKKLTIATRVPVKSTQQHANYHRKLFKRLKCQLDLYSEQWDYDKL